MGGAIALALACSLVSSAVTGLAVRRFYVRPDAVAALSAEIAAELPSNRVVAIRRTPPVFDPADLTEDALILNDGATASTPAGSVSVTAAVRTTAVIAHDLVSSLQAEYTNAYFSGRTGLKNDLNAVQTAAAQLQAALADGATAELVGLSAVKLGTTLDRTITRLDNLIQNTKDENQVEATRLIKARMEEIRATLPILAAPPF